MSQKKQKRVPRNAFYFFMVEFKDRQGIKFNSMKEVADAAGPHWAKMGKDERKPFEQQAQLAKNSMKQKKLTSQGLDVEDIERQELEEQGRIEEMKDDICLNLKLSMESGSISDQMFFIVHINFYCYCMREDRYYPAEIAVACFSLEDGVLPQNVFHRIVKPGALPFGYTADAKLVSQQTHQIPPPLAGDYDSNMKEVYFDLLHFLTTKRSGSGRYSLLYADNKMLKMIQNILDTWCNDYGDSEPLFKVCDMQYMFRILKNTVAKDVVWPSETYSNREIEKDTYAYAKGICCQFHSVSDVSIYCSRSAAIRYAYIICDNCCQDLNIILVPGIHIPDTADNINWDASCSNKARSFSGYSKSKGAKLTLQEDNFECVPSTSSESYWDNQSFRSDSPDISLEAGIFPELGTKMKSGSSFSQPKFSSGFSKQSPTNSYSGALGTSGLSKRPAALPALFSKDFKESRDGSARKSLNEYRRAEGDVLQSDLSNFPVLRKTTDVPKGRNLK